MVFGNEHGRGGGGVIGASTRWKVELPVRGSGPSAIGGVIGARVRQRCNAMSSSHQHLFLKPAYNFGSFDKSVTMLTLFFTIEGLSMDAPQVAAVPASYDSFRPVILASLDKFQTALRDLYLFHVEVDHHSACYLAVLQRLTGFVKFGNSHHCRFQSELACSRQ